MEINDTSNQNQPQNSQGSQGRPPKTWLLESILVTLFCCLPFGVAGIVYASKVESAFYSGNVQEAERVSREAKKWTMIGFWLGIAVGIIYGLLMAFGVVAAFWAQ